MNCVPLADSIYRALRPQPLTLPLWSPLLSPVRFASEASRVPTLRGADFGYSRLATVAEALLAVEQLKRRWCPKMYADKRRANKKQRRHGIFEVWKLKIPFAVPVAVGRI